jgi:Ca-activated chloride channel family protein
MPADGNAEDDETLQTIDPADVIRVNSNLVPVTASVVDPQGKAITDLKIEDFELKVDGQPKPISDIGFSNTPVRLVMLFDNSSSLSAAREFEKKAAIRFFRNVLRPIDEAAIFSISTVPILEQSLTNNVPTLVRTIEHFGKPEGATALFDAIAQAAAYLRPLQGRKVIVIVSDGADTISELDFDSTLRQAQAADCQIYAVQTGQLDYDMQTGEFKNANVRDLAAERRMQEMAVQTGGAVYVPHGTADLDTAFAQISADLAQQYILSYYPTDDKRDGRFRVISLRVATRPNARVRARKGYYTPKG